jgi:hypothetical protein
VTVAASRPRRYGMISPELVKSAKVIEMAEGERVSAVMHTGFVRSVGVVESSRMARKRRMEGERFVYGR